ncbi:hypothetical protein, partial [Nostoc sp. WHI]|uniref:hypothetical protein n=1 Tax=Nostoc sp. WHI TaxID=2650611 RepID=UPI0018C6CD4A
MTLEIKHFDPRLNQWIYTDERKTILTENLSNTLLEFYFPDKKFSFGHSDEYSTDEDLKNHPDGHILLLSSKTRLLYGEKECLETIQKICPDSKDRGAYGSIFLGACKNAIHEKLNILVVDDSTDNRGENGGILSNDLAYKLVGDCYGQISTQLSDKLTLRESQVDKSYRVIQHRFGWVDGVGEDTTKYRFGKGTLRPYRLDKIEYADPKNKPKIDIILPVSSFKGTDKDRPKGATKPQIKPGLLYQQNIWLAEKGQSQQGQMSISQLLASFPQGIKDFAEELEVQAQRLASIQDDPRVVAAYYCERYEKRKESLSQNKLTTGEVTNQERDVKDLGTNDDLDADQELDNDPAKDDLFMYKLIKADLLGHQQLLETEKVKQELSRFVQSEWRDIAIGKTLTFDRGMIIPSKELKNGEICAPWLEQGEKILNFRSPFLNSNGLCVSTNKHVLDRLAPDGEPLEGIIVVNDEDHKRIQQRITELETRGVDVDFIDPAETESERQARDYDGDCIGVARASLYPNLTAEAERRNLPQNAYSPTVKLKKQSFYLENGTQPPFEKIAIHMSDSISVGIINNQVTALEALESEIEVLNTYGTLEQKSEYLEQVSKRYQGLFEQEHDEKPKPIRAEYKPFMQSVVALAENPNRRREIIQQAMDVNRLMYREMIGEGCYQNQIAVDLFKSAKKPEMDLIRENSRYLYRDVNYIKDKKSSSAYLNTGITPKGYSPVELLISQTNKYFQESQLESRPIVQFKDLFKGVEFTPQQKFAAIAAKYEFDLKFNAAVRMSQRRETEKGPSAIVQTPQGAKLEITNLTRYGHPLIWKAQTLNIRLDEISEKFRSKERPHRLLVVAQIDGEIGEDRKPAHHKLGTVSQQSVTDHNLKAGMTMQGAKLLELKPELTRSQTKLLYALANDAALAFYAKIPESEKLALSAAAWNICASRQDELEVARKENANPQAIAKKVSNFAFAAFPNEIISRLDKLQFTEPKLVTLNNEANQFLGRDWNPTEKHPIEIRASHHPVGHERHVSRLMFVQDADGEYKEFAMLETRTAQLPIGTKAQASMVGVEPATAKATIGLPGNEPIEITIRELKNFSYAGLVFNAEPVNLEFGTVPVTDKTVKIKLDGKTLGELDSDSAQQLKEINYLKNGNPLKLKLTSISETGDQAFVLGESPNGNLLKINKINFYDFPGQTFNDQDYRKLTIETSASKTRDAVFLNGEPLGVLHFKKDKDALRQLGLLKTGQLTPAPAIIESNFSVICAQIDPNTVEYPQKWTKEFQAFGTQSVNPQQLYMIDSSAKILH